MKPATLLDTALAYHRAGLTVLPNDPQAKFPRGVQGWETIAPDEAWIQQQRWQAIGVRDVEGLDFDNKGNPPADELYTEWRELVESLAPGLPERLLMEVTPSGGYHLVWRCEVIAGNQKLATRPLTDAERAANPKGREVTLIETRGQGGQFQVAPSPGYRLMRGSWQKLPTITVGERQILLDCARALTRRPRRHEQGPVSNDGGLRPGDAFNAEGADRALGLLRAAGWKITYERDQALYLTRPGKPRGVSATFGYVAPGVLYVFSSSASPFEPETAYSPFAVYAYLQHDGDWKAAAKTLGAQGFGEQRQRPQAARRPTGGIVDQETGEIIDEAQGGETAPRDWITQGVTLAQLQRTTFAPLRWIIQDLLPEGACLLAAKPKAKKSWLALGVGIAVAMAGKALGHLDVDAGRVLFLDLEGNQRRIQSRARAMLGNQAIPWPDNFHVFTQWGRGDEGMVQLQEWMGTHPDTRLIVIDLLAEFRPPMDPKANAYDYDRGLLVELNRFAEHHHIAILIIHHTRKAKGEDVFDEVSGTLGINGAVATLWIVSRSQEGHTILNMTGRDLQKDEPLALTWDTYLCNFTIEGSAAEVAISAERRAILDLMADESPWTPKQLAAELGKSVGSVQQLLRDMLQDGTIDKAGYGKYARVPSKSDQSGTTGKSGKSGKTYQDEVTLTDPEEGGKSSVGHQDAVNGNSYHSYHDSSTDPLAPIPPQLVISVRLYLRAGGADNLARARAICEQHGADFAAVVALLGGAA